jgi:thiosulfate dehydrogenase [quinone] large subunit
MSYQASPKLFGKEVSLNLSGPWTAYWALFLRLVTGWWFLHAGWGKLTAAEPFSAAGYLANAGGTPWMSAFFSWAASTPWLLELTNFMIPVGEFLIGLGLVLGALTRLASFFGALLMFFFYFGNGAWEHGFVNSDLMGLLLFLTIIVMGAGRVFGVDGYLEQLSFVKQNRWVRYLLG